MNIWGYEEIVDIFWGSLQTRTILGVISIHFRAVFLKVKVQRGISSLGR